MSYELKKEAEGQPEAPATIVSVEFEAAPKIVKLMPGDDIVVKYTASDGSSGILFRFYSDEIRFSRQELIGLTIQEAHLLRHNRDVAYLQSPW